MILISINLFAIKNLDTDSHTPHTYKFTPSCSFSSITGSIGLLWSGLKIWWFLWDPYHWFSTLCIQKQRMIQHWSCCKAQSQYPACVWYKTVNVHNTRNSQNENCTILNHTFTVDSVCLCFHHNMSRFQIQLDRWALRLWSFVPSSQMWIHLSKLPCYFSFKTLSFPWFSMTVLAATIVEI